MSIFQFMVEHAGLLLEKSGQLLFLSLAAVAVATLIAVPVGVTLGHFHRGGFLATSVANGLRALPSLALISVGIGVLGIGFTNVLVALVVLAMPAMLINSYAGVDGIEREVVDAGRGLGMSGWTIVRKVEVPLAMPLILGGLRTSTVFTISAATIAGLAGGGGLGDIVVDQATYGLDGVLAASIWVAALALIADSFLSWIARRAAARVTGTATPSRRTAAPAAARVYE